MPGFGIRPPPSMNDIDTLLARLREAASEEPPPIPEPDGGHARAWSPARQTGIREALADAWSDRTTPDLLPFLVADGDGFVALAFLRFVGRLPDPGGRSHYLGLLQQGRPRLEVLAEIGASAEAVLYQGKPKWPFWLDLMLRAMRMPFSLARRGGRAVLRRLEGRLARRARNSPQGLVWRLATAVDDRNRIRDRDMDAVARDFKSHGDAVTQRLGAVDERLAAADQRLAKHEASQAAANARFAVLERDHPAVHANSARSDQPPGVVRADPDPLTRYYLTLEAAFRGDPARIRQQLETDYLALLVEAREEIGDGPCIDLGCGRGEWLEVLRENGFAARGVDLNPYMAADAHARGNDVTVADAVSFLRTIEDDSVLAISAFHLAEHLEFATLYELIGECRRALKPGGRLILETPNPENIWVATHTFHHDPSHRNPLTPASLEFLVNHHGLETIAVLRLHPYPEDARLPGQDPASERLNGMTCGPQDFAVVARKTPLA